MTQRAVVSLSMPSTLLAQLRAISVHERRTLSSVASELLAEGLDRAKRRARRAAFVPHMPVFPVDREHLKSMVTEVLDSMRDNGGVN